MQSPLRIWTTEKTALELSGLVLDSDVKPAYLNLLTEANQSAW